MKRVFMHRAKTAGQASTLTCGCVLGRPVQGLVAGVRPGPIDHAEGFLADAAYPVRASLVRVWAHGHIAGAVLLWLSA